jgi:S-DNA-T family DNA segregation ATPase FtsK/SpoIIIE
MARDRALLAEAGRRGARVEPPTPAALRTLFARWECEAPGSIRVLVVDDADALTQSAPLETEQLAELAADGAVTVLAAATTLTAAMAQRGLLAQLRTTRTGLVLSPAERGAQDVFGVPLDYAADPGPPRPGRAALVVDGAVTAIQLATPSADAE